jgi:hypothetical protein
MVPVDLTKRRYADIPLHLRAGHLVHPPPGETQRPRIDSPSVHSPQGDECLRPGELARRPRRRVYLSHFRKPKVLTGGVGKEWRQQMVSGALEDRGEARGTEGPPRIAAGPLLGPGEGAPVGDRYRHGDQAEAVREAPRLRAASGAAGPVTIARGTENPGAHPPVARYRCGRWGKRPRGADAPVTARHTSGGKGAFTQWPFSADSGHCLDTEETAGSPHPGTTPPSVEPRRHLNFVVGNPGRPTPKGYPGSVTTEKWPDPFQG